jgi:multidrug efflux pump subunit AcrA (membrane-fusion protein)
MYVNVAFATIGGSENTVPVVPAAAVQNINNQQVVFVATNDPNVFRMRPVRVGPEAGGRVPVLVGERVVTDGSFLLRAEWLKLHPGG